MWGVRVLLKFMMLLLVAAFVGLFFVKGPGGEPVLSVDDFTPELPDVESEAPGQPEKVYRWQDENGVWQFSNQPQDAVIADALGETVEYDGNINTIPAIQAPPASASSSKSPTSQLSIPTTVSGEQAQQMMDTVNNLQQTVDERKAEMDRLTGGN